MTLTETPINFLSLFSGIGGLDIGLEWAGWNCTAMCEFDPFCCALLHERFPGVPVYPDVRTIEATRHQYDAVVGGFPCQDISSAGKGEGIEGSRSGLWKEMHRVIDLVRPRWVVAENVPALRTRGADRVLGDLEGIGYTCWPFVVGADDIGAPHRRKRVFIIGQLADSDGLGRWAQSHRSIEADQSYWRITPFPPRPYDYTGWRLVLEVRPELAPAQVEPVVCRMADGLSVRLGRRWRRSALKGLGNSVVPQVGELIGETINRFEAAKAGAP